MQRICPKCRHARQPGEQAPDWQCPACGVAYAKAGEAGRPVDREAATRADSGSSPGRSPTWRKWLWIAAAVLGIWGSHQASRDKHGGAARSGDWLGGSPSAAELRSLAAGVGPGEVLMYSTTECPYCAEAKGWLHQNGFAFTECNMSSSARCESEFRALGGKGTPYLIVRGRHMKDGFDSGEFIADLKG